ncbi:MAG TPA: NAD-dependent epimerase/dehydratase family protein [Candidatus Polarisedimenticolaceae bacterium]|nr:NAD-dependent epimerase/dehydratase family protein [Candidatus Polarisedimenticolaceae bacterium]
MRVLVAGLGWLGEAVARELAAAGHEVTGIRRRFPDEAALQAAGIRPLVCDLADFHAVRRLPDVDGVVVCAAPHTHGEDAYREAYVEINEALLERYAGASLSAYVYTSSTSVFGQSDGGDVDEDTAVHPVGATAEILVEAEHRVRGAAGTVPTRIVRLSGLYGPGRTGILDRVRRGQLALGGDDLHWMNFCHRDDGVAFVRGALEGGAAGAVYHGSDAHPARRRDVVLWVAERLGVQPAVHHAGQEGPHRRVLSEKSRRTLGISLRYPSYREGLEALLRAP